METNKAIELTPAFSGKLRILSLLAIGCVVLQHASYGVSTETATGLLYRDLVALGFADFPVPYFFIVSGFGQNVGLPSAPSTRITKTS